MKLNARQIDTAKPKEKAYKLADGGGLYLLVKPSGGKYWRFKYRVADVFGEDISTSSHEGSVVLILLICEERMSEFCNSFEQSSLACKKIDRQHNAYKDICDDCADTHYSFHCMRQVLRKISDKLVGLLIHAGGPV